MNLQEYESLLVGYPTNRDFALVGAGMEDAISESCEVSKAEGVALEDFYFVICAFCKTVGVGVIQ